MITKAGGEERPGRSDSCVLRQSTLTTFDLGIPDSYNKVVMEGYLKRKLGGIFVKWRKCWAVLLSNGHLNLSKNKDTDCFASINVCEFQELTYAGDDLSFALSSVIGGTIETLKFIVADAHTLSDWVVSFSSFISYNNSDALSTKNVSASVSTHDDLSFPVNEEIRPIDILPGEYSDDTEDRISIDPTEKVQTGGEPVKKSGFIKKRGGAKGGSTAFKRRWFVLTQLGRVLYFRAPRSFQALGQFTVVKATLIECAKSELKIVTLSRTWELQFDSNEERNEWTQCINEILNLDEHHIQNARSVRAHEMRRKTLPKVIPSSLLICKSASVPPLSFECPVDVVGERSGKWLEIQVACVTWNLAESLPKIGNLRFLKKLCDCDVVTIGVQECQPVMYRSFASDELTPIDVWQAMVHTMLGDSFALVATRAMGAIHICVLAKHTLVSCIGDVNTTHVSCGFGNVMHNKGAVGVSMRIHNTYVAFICAHFAANREKVVERNNDFHRVASHMVGVLGKAVGRSIRESRNELATVSPDSDHDFTHNANEDIQSQEWRSTLVELCANPLSADSAVNVHKKGLAHWDHDISHNGNRLAKCFDRCFFLGDLNYRLEAEKQWVQTLLAMRERMLLLDDERSYTSTSIPQESGDMTDKQYVKSEDIRDNEEINDPRENGVQMLINMLPQVSYGSDCEDDCVDDDDDDDELPNMDAVSLEKQSSLGDSIVSCSVSSSQKNDHIAVKDTPTVAGLVREVTSGEQIMDVVNLSDNSALLDSPSGDKLCRATSDISNLTIESDTIRIVNELLRASNDEDEDAQLLLETPTNVSKSPIYSSKLLSDSAKHTLDFFVTQTGLDRPIKVIERLLCFDQLLNEKRKGAIFQGFDEGNISFKPSYKFDPYTETFDTGKKSRAPAWCDRILYSSPRYEKELSLLSYECEHGKYHSDHRAVIAKFSVRV